MIDFVKTTLKGSKIGHGGSNKIEYQIKTDIAKEIAMIAGVAGRANKETKELSMCILHAP